jgi:hypothetical protein
MRYGRKHSAHEHFAEWPEAAARQAMILLGNNKDLQGDLDELVRWNDAE